ncbi:hypothetical protein [Streptomyces sp. UG1]|uniref:hypothetical protein n=1 Tax=Streptomyces sp. UG1 TaxID=3417652 RepID=UPI003CF4D736
MWLMHRRNWARKPGRERVLVRTVGHTLITNASESSPERHPAAIPLKLRSPNF